SRFFLAAVVLGSLCGVTGCAAMSNPIAQGVPVRRLPPEYLASPKDETHLIPQTLLQRQPPDIYRVDAGDILGLDIATALGEQNQPIPVRFPDRGNATPALGFPVPVREDGPIVLPQIPPLQVKGLSLTEIQQLLLKRYTEPEQLIKKGNEPLVTLMRPRSIQ